MVGAKLGGRVLHHSHKTGMILKVASAIAASAATVFSFANADLLDEEVKNKKYSTSIELSGGLEADLTVSFEHPTGLTTQSLGVSATVVNPLDPSLLSRLQAAGAVSIPAGFPVMVSIEPPANGGLSFEGLTKIELYTKNLHYTAGSPLRIFSASHGGDFHDITELNASGSYRTRGSKGTYSDFLIIADVRPLSTVIGTKFTRIDDALLDHATTLGVSLHTELTNELNAARTAWQASDYDGALDAIEDFEETVSDAAGGGQIPNEWRASGGVENIAGSLRANARTLRFSLTLGANGL